MKYKFVLFALLPVISLSLLLLKPVTVAGATSILRVASTGKTTWPCGGDWATDTCSL